MLKTSNTFSIPSLCFESFPPENISGVIDSLTFLQRWDSMEEFTIYSFPTSSFWKMDAKIRIIFFVEVGFTIAGIKFGIAAIWCFFYIFPFLFNFFRIIFIIKNIILFISLFISIISLWFFISNLFSRWTSHKILRIIHTIYIFYFFYYLILYKFS